MGDDARFGSSLLRARHHDFAHREHLRHDRLHIKRQEGLVSVGEGPPEESLPPVLAGDAAPLPVPLPPPVTEPETSPLSIPDVVSTLDATSTPSNTLVEVVETVNVVQQINVDQDGKTLNVQTLIASTTPPPDLPLASGTPGLDPTLLDTSRGSDAVLANSTTTDSSSLSTSTPLLTLAASLNDTQISSSSSSHLFLNTTISTTSTSTSTLTGSSTSASTSVYLTAVPTAADGRPNVFGHGDAAGVPAATTESHDSTSNGDDSPGSPPMPVVVGSVVGAVAGSALMLVILLYLFRYWKRKQGYEHHGGGRLASSDGPSTMVTTITGPGAHSRPKSIIYAVPAALASLTGYKGRSPPPDDPPADEKGFYRVSGRKLPSVLTSGGDGYGDETSSKASFYRDSTGRTAIAMRESGVPMMRPSPARTPVTERGPLELPAPGMLSDGIGRSHASQDGSRATKFAEEV